MRPLIAAFLFAFTTIGTVARATESVSQPAAALTNRKAVEPLRLVCVPPNIAPPEGYTAVAFSSVSGDPIKSICACPASTPHMKLAMDAVTVAGAYKLLKVTHDTKLNDVVKELKRLEVPNRVIARSAPKILKLATSNMSRKVSVGGLVATVVIAAEEGISNLTVRKLQSAPYAIKMQEYESTAAAGSSEGIYAIKKYSEPIEELCKKPKEMSVNISAG